MKLKTRIRIISLASLMALLSFFSASKAQSPDLDKQVFNYITVARQINDKENRKEIDLKKHPEIQELGGGLLKQLEQDLDRMLETKDFERATKTLALIYKLGETFDDSDLMSKTSNIEKAIEKWYEIRLDWNKALEAANSFKNEFKHRDITKDIQETDFRLLSITIKGKYFVYIKNRDQQTYAVNPDTLKIHNSAFQYKPDPAGVINIMFNVTQSEQNEDVISSVNAQTPNMEPGLRAILLKTLLENARRK